MRPSEWAKMSRGEIGSTLITMACGFAISYMVNLEAQNKTLTSLLPEEVQDNMEWVQNEFTVPKMARKVSSVKTSLENEMLNIQSLNSKEEQEKYILHRLSSSLTSDEAL